MQRMTERFFEPQKGLPPLVLAPMEDITDPPFRRLCRRFGADMAVTEFISADGLIRDADKGSQKLNFFPKERPIGIQVYGNDPEVVAAAGQIVAEAGPDFVDFNAGCPVPKVVKKGSGAALLRDLPLFRRIIRKLRQAISLPLSVKTRIGWSPSEIIIEDVVRMLTEEGVDFVAIHGRTRDQAYKGQADWSYIRKSAQMGLLPVIGNGDLRTGEDLRRRLDEVPEIAAFMVGRAAVGQPWVFEAMKRWWQKGENWQPGIVERVSFLKEHLRFAIEQKGEPLGIMRTRKHFSGYLKGEPFAAKVRAELMQKEDFVSIERLLDSYLESLGHL